MKNLSNTALRNLVIAVPPFPEQSRIVRFLDEALEGIEIAKTNSGKSIQNTRALFHGYTRSMFANRGEALGYGYQITARPGWKPDNEIAKYSGAIDEIVNRFGRLKPSELELLSTLIYVDRDAREKNRRLTFDKLIDDTHEIKPHFSKSALRTKAEQLAGENLLNWTCGLRVYARSCRLTVQRQIGHPAPKILR